MTNKKDKHFKYVDSIVSKYFDVIDKYSYLVYGAPEIYLPLEKDKLKAIILEYISLLFESNKLDNKYLSLLRFSYGHLSLYYNQDDAQQAAEAVNISNIDDNDKRLNYAASERFREMIKRYREANIEMIRLYAEFDEFIKKNNIPFNCNICD
jgi:hypothetical protein